MGLNKADLTKYVGAPLALVGGGYYLSNSHPEVLNLVGSTVGKIGALIEPTYEAGLEAIKNVPIIGEAAPFAFPMIAGGSLGYKLSDLLKIENNLLKHGFGVLGAGLGVAASKSILAPYLGIYGLYKTGMFIKDKEIIQRLFKGVLNPVLKVAEGAKKTIIDPFIALKKGLVDNTLEKPKFNY